MKSNFTRRLIMLITMLFCAVNLTAQHIDQVLFGNTSSEAAHGLNSYNPSGIQTISGQAGQAARRFLPDANNPYQGIYTGTYGGEMSFVMRVDSTKQNYFTGKFSGDSIANGRILLNVEGKEVGGRHVAGELLFLDNSENGQPLSPGAFFYRTAPIPRSLTDHKAFIVIRLRSTGYYFKYGSMFNYGTYQMQLTAPTTGIYRAYMHTNAAFALPNDDTQGATQNYASLSSTPDNISTLKATILQKNNNCVTDYLNADVNNLARPSDSYYSQIEVLAYAYNNPQNTTGYHNAAILNKIKAVVDRQVINQNNNTYTAGQLWGGSFGRSAYAVSMVYNQLTGLDSVVNLGGGSNLTRRQQWITIFQASFDAGATNRKTITAQEMEVCMNVYAASLGLAKLDSVTYSNYPRVAIHLALEGCGIEPSTGPLLNLAAKNPTLNTQASALNGAGFYFITTKGTSHEPVWVSPDCYGNLAAKFIEFYHMSMRDPNITTYGVGKGDRRFLDKGVAHTKTQAAITYPWILDGKKTIVGEGVICGRNAYMPGETYYGNLLTAAESKDLTAIGYIKQMQDDGQLNEYYQIANPVLSWVHFLPDAIDTIAAISSTIKIPSTTGQPDFVSADEANGIVAIKRGEEHVFLTFFNNKTGLMHIITPSNERTIEFKKQIYDYYPSGQVNVRGSSVLYWSGEAPDKPISAYAGEVDSVVSYDNTTNSSFARQLYNFCQVQVGKYLIAMNMTTGTTKTVQVPAAMVGKSGYNVATGSTITLPATISLAPSSTLVYYVASIAETPGLLPDPTPAPTGTITKTNLNNYVTAKEAFNTDIENTVKKVSTNFIGGYYKYDLYDIFNRKLTAAKFIGQYANATQAQVDTALAQVTRAYNDLVGNKYPIINPYNRVEAENYTSQSNTLTENCSDTGGGLNVSYADAGDYLVYAACNFGTSGARKAYIRYAFPTSATNSKIHIRLGSPTGPLVNSFNLPSTGGWQTWKTDSCKIYGTNGLQDLYLVLGNSTNINWFRFDSTVVNYLQQTISFGAMANATLATADFTPTASASSALPVTFTSTNPAVATIVNGKVHIVGAGSTHIIASQPGNWTYDSALSVKRLLIVSGIAAGDYVSTGNMQWNGGTWNISNGSGGYSSTTTTTPSATNNVIILAGHTVTLSGTSGACKSITVQSGATLVQNIDITVSGSTVMNGTLNSLSSFIALGDLAITGTWSVGGLNTYGDVDITSTGILQGYYTAGGYVQAANFYGNNPTITVDGRLGGTAAGVTGESIRIVPFSTGTTTFTGSGSIFVASFQASNGSEQQDFIIDANMNFNNSISGWAGFTLLNGSANKTLTINAGKTVTLSNGGCGFHYNASATSPNNGNYGSMIYNINGTLDVKSAPFVLYSSTNTSSPNLKASTLVNVGNTGVLKLGANVRMNKSLATQNVAINVASGGVIDGSTAALNLTNSPVSDNNGNVWFTLKPGAVYKRLTTSNVAAPLWIGTSNSNYNPVTVTPATGTVFTVGIVDGVSNISQPQLNTAINKTWNITPATVSPTTLSFAYKATDANVSCTPSSNFGLLHYNTTTSTWEYFGTATPTTAPNNYYTVSYANINAFSPFALSNSGGALPLVQFIFSAKKINGQAAMLLWQTKNETGLKEFIIEKSTNGINFLSIGVTAAQNKDLNNYQFTDNQLKEGYNYYRIKQVEADGSYKISDIQIVKSGEANMPVFDAFPNPVKNTVTVIHPKGNGSRLQLFSTDGKLVIDQYIVDGAVQTMLDMSKIAAGTYILNYKGKTYSSGIKLIKQVE